MDREMQVKFRCLQSRLPFLLFLTLSFLGQNLRVSHLCPSLPFPHTLYSIYQWILSLLPSKIYLELNSFSPLPLCHSIPSNQATIICHTIYSNRLLTGLSDSILNPSQSILPTATSDPLQIKSCLSLARKPLMISYYSYNKI